MGRTPSGKTHATKCRHIAAAKTATREGGEGEWTVDQRRDRAPATDVLLDHPGRAETTGGDDHAAPSDAC
jgi:hypothetical protein